MPWCFDAVYGLGARLRPCAASAVCQQPAGLALLAVASMWELGGRVSICPSPTGSVLECSAGRRGVRACPAGVLTHRFRLSVWHEVYREPAIRTAEGLCAGAWPGSFLVGSRGHGVGGRLHRDRRLSVGALPAARRTDAVRCSPALVCAVPSALPLPRPAGSATCNKRSSRKSYRGSASAWAMKVAPWP